MAPKPFTMQRQVKIKGGFTDQAIDLDTEVVDGLEFAELKPGHQYMIFSAMGINKNNGKLCRALLDHLRDARTSMVDALLRAVLKDEDPWQMQMRPRTWMVL